MNRTSAALAAIAATLLCACASTYGAKQIYLAPYALTIRMHVGERLLERVSEIDRIEWKLPERRLEQFRKGGAVIKEEQRVTIVVRSTVLWVSGGIARLLDRAALTSLDVPRHTHRSFEQTFTTALRINNVAVSHDPLAIENAAMTQLPSAQVRLGQHWQTRLSVTTSLGSGFITLDHEAVSIDNGLLKIAVRGSGEIIGSEYHLPRLLPGSIELTGAAWYDLQSGLITQESYLIHNRLLKPMEGEQQGFDEILTVDVSTRKQGAR